MVDKKISLVKVILTPEERDAAREAAKSRRIQRDRKRRLSDVSRALTCAGEAIASGDVSLHDRWLAQAYSALESYRSFVHLTESESTATDDSPGF